VIVTLVACFVSALIASALPRGAELRQGKTAA